MKKRLAIIVTVLVTVAMVFAMSASIYAEESDPVVINSTPYVIQDLTLDAGTYGVGLDGTGTSTTYIANYKYTSRTAGIMDLEIARSSSDKHPGLGEYSIKINGNDVSEEAAKSYTLAKGEYSIQVTRTYPSVQADPWISISAKALPVDITEGFQTEYTDAEEGTDNLTRFYKFKPAQNGGYELTISGLNESTLDNQFVQIIVENKSGKKLNESATLDDGQKSCKLRVYLYGGTEYVISVRDEKVNMTGSLADMKYTFSMKQVPSNEGLSVGGAKSLVLGSTESCALNPFVNKRAFAWYSFTASEDGYYEFVLSEKTAVQTDESNDIIVELRDSDFSPAEEEDQLYLYSGEGGTIVRKLSAGETCYLQVCEMYKGCLSDVYIRDLLVKNHTHAVKAVVDGDHVTLACPCMDEEQWVADYWFNGIKFNDVEYTGAEVMPTPSFKLNAWSSKDDKKPTIPETAYTITVTSKNKTEIGKAKAKLTFIGDYEDFGSYTASFKIVPAGTTLKTVTAGTKAMTVKWAKQSKNTTGYQIQYSTKANFGGSKTVTVAKKAATSKKIAKLKSGKTYYVRVRTYKKLGKTNYYSAWSDAMNTTVM